MEKGEDGTKAKDNRISFAEFASMVQPDAMRFEQYVDEFRQGLAQCVGRHSNLRDPRASWSVASRRIWEGGSRLAVTLAVTLTITLTVTQAV